MVRYNSLSSDVLVAVLWSTIDSVYYI